MRESDRESVLEQHPRETDGQGDRRRAPRISVSLPVQIVGAGATGVGTVIEISVTGLVCRLPLDVSVRVQDQVEASILAGEGVVSLTGAILAFREAAGSGETQTLAVGFAALPRETQTALQAILDAHHQDGVELAVTLGLRAPDTGAVLLELHGGSARSVGTPDGPTGDRDGSDRRAALRLPIGGSVHLYPLAQKLPPVVDAALVDLGLGGAGCRLLSPHGLQPGHVVNCRIAVTEDHELDRWTLQATVVWMDPVRPDFQASGRSLGLAFDDLDAARRTVVARVLGRSLMVAPPSDGEARPGVASEWQSIRHPAGYHLAAYVDQVREGLPYEAPVVVLVPGYGETKREYVALAYTLAANGCRVVRYDHSAHVGESDGDLLTSTLGRMEQDLRAMLAWATGRWTASPLILVAASLAARVAIRVAAWEPRIVGLVTLAGVVDVQATLTAVHQEDLVGEHLRGHGYGVISMLGFRIDADAWLADAVRAGYADLAGTRRDAARLHMPWLCVVPEQDAWVDRDAVQAVLAAGPSAASRRLILIPEGLHRLQENPRKARAVARTVARWCQDVTGRGRPWQEPAQRDIAVQGRCERERARARQQFAQPEHQAFWQDYLDHFGDILHVPDFWQLLDHVYRSLGPLPDGARVLDAGCGNGTVGLSLLVNQAYRRRHSGAETPPCVYTGVDFVPAALERARQALEDAAAKLGPAGTCLQPTWTVHDLNTPLPFPNGAFDRIACNLVLGYLADPAATLREFVRVLAPGGRLVLTNLKPQADLTQVYRRFAERADTRDAIETGRQLLDNAGKIRQWEGEGAFRFFTRQELLILLVAAGVDAPRISATFANQAYLAVAEKAA